jgi:hypothetical protein
MKIYGITLILAQLIIVLVMFGVSMDLIDGKHRMEPIIKPIVNTTEYVMNHLPWNK